MDNRIISGSKALGKFVNALNNSGVSYLGVFGVKEPFCISMISNAFLMSMAFKFNYKIEASCALANQPAKRKSKERSRAFLMLIVASKIAP
ncbi:hypothetical protein [Zobellia laminariae]|uniref:hypothetical protein n=1 Tax=Zobellia laminariae TaxID=248906 RepID=UPI0026F436C1|nr:hypothetical protein [Zobellia laminariae]WKX74752.1 hypothetical protein Q5W13_13160 [Zobellia laminariae]